MFDWASPDSPCPSDAYMAGKASASDDVAAAFKNGYELGKKSKDEGNHENSKTF